ncbi:MAG: alpha-amylase/4-alpha-glucanotransferase domain-containing protein [Candidatus Zixiibacteriota bacterium]
MAQKINFCFGIHNHQPIGNFQHIFEDAYQRCYWPFLKILKKYPHFKLSLHYSGILLEWLKKNHPEACDEIAQMVEKGQAELLTGGFYEPIMPVIPDWDKKGQINKLTEFIKNEFKTIPWGMWLAERVWEPHLPKIISESGIKFVILDDTHFKYSGLTEQQLFGYYVTEEQGFMTKLFPISKVLRYTIPFKEPRETLEYFKEIAKREGDPLIVYADDGEKFGTWPGTYKHCYENGWMVKFFEAIEKNSDWINMLHFSEALEKLPPLGRIYLPTSSYAEMSQWSLPAQGFREYENLENFLKDSKLFDKFGIFVRGGFWRNFLAKYPEANHLHKRTLDLSQRVHSLFVSNENLKRTRLKEAQDELWKSQCNCPYWHGVFGGLYLNHLREAVYSHLIRGDEICNQLIHKNRNWVDYRLLDLDKDGKDDLLINTPWLNLYLSPSYGGALYELDYLPESFNLINTLSRWEEGYHKKILNSRKAEDQSNNPKVASIHDLVLTKEEGLEKYLTYDWYRRGSLIDHFLGDFTQIDSFSRCKYPEQGDFVNQPYRHKLEKEGKKLKLTLTRNGWVWAKDKRIPLSLTKIITLKADSPLLEISYQIKNSFKEEVDLWFGVEFNFTPSTGGENKKIYYINETSSQEKDLSDKSQSRNILEFGMKDQKLKIDVNLKTDRPAFLWHFPILTVSLSESGFEKNFQSLVLFPNWKMRLEPGQIWSTKIKQSIDRIR